MTKTSKIYFQELDAKTKNDLKELSTYFNTCCAA